MSLLKAEIQRELAPRKVGIVEFAESDEFCGKDLYPGQRVLMKLIFLEEMEGWEEDILTSWINGGKRGEVLMSPNIRERRDFLRENGYPHFTETVLVGGRRSSKGFVTGLAGAKKIYDVQQIPDPGKYFGIDKDKEIVFAVVAASLNQAKTLQFADLVSSTTRCRALREHVGRVLEEGFSIHTEADRKYLAELKAEGIDVSRDWAKLRAKPLAANADTLRGSTMIFLAFDEMAFFLPGESNQTAEKCYEAAEPSLATFGRNAMIFCNSSPYQQLGKFAERYKFAMQDIDHVDGWFPTMFTMKFPSWTLYEDYHLDAKQRFRDLGAKMVSPDTPDEELTNPNDRAIAYGERLKERANPESYAVERRSQWAQVLDAYLDPRAVDRAFSGLKPSGDPCKMTEGGVYIYEYAGHCDPSSTTAGFGFAMGHIEMFPDPTGLFPDGMARHVIFDRVFRWNPMHFPGNTINYLKVQEELLYWCEVYRPRTLTFDQYNSIGLIQGLRVGLQEKGISGVSIGKVDATAKLNWDRWECFKTCLNLGLVHIPDDCLTVNPEPFNHSEWASFELKSLTEISSGQTKRVDKQEVGPIKTKDVADCICEVTWKFMASFVGDLTIERLSKLKIIGGAEGGYQIGGRNPGGPMSGMPPRSGINSPMVGTGSHASPFDHFSAGRGNNNPMISRGIVRRGRR